MSATDFSQWGPALAPLAGWPEVQAQVHNPNRIARLWADLRAWRARRQTLHALHSLDGRTLKDIGIGAPEIESIVYAGRDDRRRRYDRDWWRAASPRHAAGSMSRPSTAPMAKA